MSDDAERRLRASDPAGVQEPWSAGEVHRVVTQVRDRDAAAPPPREAGVGRRVVLPLAAAAGVVALAGVTTVVLTDDEPAGPPAATVLRLTLPEQAMMTSCVPFSTDVLAQMPTAFAGEVAAVEPQRVFLDVDTWYRGGSADRVALVTPGDEVLSLDGQVDFTEGHRYLVTAAETGTVNFCGFTAPWTPDLAREFETAFGS